MTTTKVCAVCGEPILAIESQRTGRTDYVHGGEFVKLGSGQSGRKYDHPATPEALPKDDLTEVTVGQRLCEVGRGSANRIHRHAVVKRLTKLYIVTEFKNKDGTHEKKFRRDSGRSVPYSDYGGSSLHTACQRPKKDSEQ